MMLGFTVQEASAIGIIGGADGPTAIYLAAKMAPNLLGAIAVAAYSYMSLVPLIQPPIMKLCTTEADRKIVMAQLRPVTRFEKIVFPIATTIVISLLLPPVTALIGMLMLGNLFKEAGCLDRLSDTAQNALMNIVTIMLATGTGLTMKAESFLNYQTILIICLGLVAFAAGTLQALSLVKSCVFWMVVKPILLSVPLVYPQFRWQHVYPKSLVKKLTLLTSCSCMLWART